MNTAREVKAAIGHDDCSVHDPCEASSPETCPYERARKKRQADKAGAWDALVVKREPGGLRHYLDGKVVHCGVELELQHTAEADDDYGTYSVPLPRGSVVRYEASWVNGKVDATLYHYIGNHEFTANVEPWMRFRWPKGSR